MKKYFFLFLILFGAVALLSAQDTTENKDIVYIFGIKEQIAKPVWRVTQKSFEEAFKAGAKVIIIEMNTYGGVVDVADSIRTKILNSPIPVYMFINDNAASAGALISIACDSIYMRPGAKIGAATVVNQTGQAVPDKYQSYMRATMRATAEAQGKETIITGKDTITRWKRDPHIAEAMVDPVVIVPGVTDSGKVLTFTAEEAIQHGYCEGLANDIREVMVKAGISDYTIQEFKPTLLDKIIGFLLNPAIQGLLIMAIVGGMYFELQSPGVGLPLGVAVTGAIMYFAPLYLEGLAQNWEIIIFFLGAILLLVEIFALPGFGVAGISGIVLIITGLTMAMVDNFVFESGDMTMAINAILKALVIVIGSLLLATVISLFSASKISDSRFFSKIALDSVQKNEEGFTSAVIGQSLLIGKEGYAHTVLRPSGKVFIGSDIYDAKAEYGFIAKGAKIKVTRYETGQLYVESLNES